MAREMKDSGVAWIGEIPSDWDVFPLKRLCSMQAGKNLISEQIKLSGEYPVYGGNGLRGYFDEFNNDGEYLLVGRQGALCGNVHRVAGRFWATEHAIVTSTSPLAKADFLYYLLTAMDLNQYASDVAAQPGLSVNSILNVKTCSTSFAQQIRIAAFLDKKCAEIDAVLEKTRTSIEEYKKLKQAIITQAVTKGVRGDRPMKESGIEWVRLIPEEWESVNPKALFSQRKDKASPGERQLTSSQKYGIVYQDDYMELTGSRVVVVQKDFDILKHVETGDFIISMRSFQGGLEYSTKTGSISSAYVMLIPNHDFVYPRFYRWLLKSEVYIRALQRTSNMVRDGQAMRYSNFAQVRLYTVPLQEQMEIADYLDKTCAMLDALIEKKENFIFEIESYKKSLIYEYVTGKKEVPNAAQIS